jgi:hypothetical protein
MTARVSQVVAHEAATGLRQLVGSHITAAIEVSETVLGDALRNIRELPRTLTVHVAPANRIVVRYGAIHATALLAEAVDPRGPRITIELQSTVFAWALQRAIKTPAVAVRGRRVTIDLGRLEALAALSGVWEHFRSVRFSTADGTLFVHVDFAVT